MAELLKLVLKTFWSATFMGVPAVLLRSDQFNGWTSCFLELIRRPVPQARRFSAVTLQLCHLIHHPGAHPPASAPGTPSVCFNLFSYVWGKCTCLRW